MTVQCKVCRRTVRPVFGWRRGALEVRCPDRGCLIQKTLRPTPEQVALAGPKPAAAARTESLFGE